VAISGVSDVAIEASGISKGVLNISLSIVLPQGYSELLYVVIGVCIARAAESALGIDVGLRWPNKVVLRNKTAGFYRIERLSESGEGTLYRVNITLNLYSNTARLLGLDTSLSSELGDERADWESLITRLVSEVKEAARHLREGVTSRFIIEYSRRFANLGEEVRAILKNDSIIEGTVMGLSRDGSIIIMSGGELRSIKPGSIKELRTLWP